MVARRKAASGRFIVGARTAALITILCADLLPAAAEAYCRTTTCARVNAPPECVRDPTTGCWTAGTPLSWPESCVSFSVDQTGSPKAGLDYQSALQIVSAAFARWPAATCEDGLPSIAVQATAAPLVCERVEYNSTGPNANGVIFQDQSWPHDAAIIGLTTVTFNVKTAEILDADMEINTAEQEFTPDIMSFVVTHEAGHFFGLDHTRDQSAVMYPQFSGFVAEGGVVLTPDDVAGICAAYPASRPRSSTCDFEPPKGFAPDCGGDVVASCAVPAAVPRGGRWDESLIAALMTSIVAVVRSRRRPVRNGRRCAGDRRE